MTRVGGLGETGDESARPLWRREVEKRGVSLELWVAWLGEHKRGTALHSVTEGSGFPLSLDRHKLLPGPGFSREQHIREIVPKSGCPFFQRQFRD